uniref:Uncharacterized protein n=1 Tax=Rhizophagus irregularis (strain DAOM 181602 / DAOM 197198 / MUCL 43194) TaxID=747089 RepID=U9SLG3_RHIID
MLVFICCKRKVSLENAIKQKTRDHISCKLRTFMLIYNITEVVSGEECLTELTRNGLRSFLRKQVPCKSTLLKETISSETVSKLWTITINSLIKNYGQCKLSWERN